MPTPSLDELRKLKDAHDAIQDFAERCMDRPPELRIARRCRNCGLWGMYQRYFQIGWSAIEWAIAHNDPLPEEIMTTSCPDCEDEEVEDAGE